MGTEGVWVTYFYDNGAVLDRVHSGELAAYRYANKEGGWLYVIFLPFNTDLSEVINAARDKKTNLVAHNTTRIMRQLTNQGEHHNVQDNHC